MGVEKYAHRTDELSQKITMGVEVVMVRHEAFKISIFVSFC